LRTPSVLESLKVFNEIFGAPIHTIVDVGVLSGTSFLMSVYNKSKHYLFEPVVAHHQSIQDEYRRQNIEYELIGAAVSDVNGMLYQHLLSDDFSGNITSSQLMEVKAPEKFGKQLLGIIDTPVVTLDSWSSKIKIEEPYLVKIDVDGIEEKIIEGGQSFLTGAAVVIIEAHLSDLVVRASKLERLNLRLFDIVGNGYYFDQLQQVDLVFVNGSIISGNSNFRPGDPTGKVIWDRWQQYV
jgi:FkbM family methyltransferase